jgi:hypothetical protein
MKRKSIRWNPVKPDPTGSMRGGDAYMFAALNERVLNSLHGHAVKVDARLRQRRQRMANLSKTAHTA